jgi:hypothetical protein
MDTSSIDIIGRHTSDSPVTRYSLRSFVILQGTSSVPASFWQQHHHVAAVAAAE